MSRKAKLTVLRDRLEMVSECPDDILNKLVPDEEDFANIEKAEHGDTVAIITMVQRLYETYKEEKSFNTALCYYLKKGIEVKDAHSARLALSCIDSFNSHFELFDDAIAILSDGEKAELTERIDSISLKKIIAEQGVENGINTPVVELDKIKSKPTDYARVYLYGKADHRTEDELAIIQDAADKVDLSRITTLPSFASKAEAAPELKCDDVSKEISSLKHAISLYGLDEWYDFWLRAAYEYALCYLDADISCFVEDMINSISQRADYPRKKLHLLAFERYLTDKGLGQGREGVEDEERLCRFDGLTFDLDSEASRDEVIKDAVYTSAKTVREEANLNEMLGARILHERNRYKLDMTLTNHQKRASRHQWEVTVSIEMSDDTPPVIDNIPIVERRAHVSRNGIVLEKEKRSSQVICKGDILLGERALPFEMDLLLDISFVSTTKCSHASIRVDRYKRIGDYLVMQANLIIY